VYVRIPRAGGEPVLDLYGFMVGSSGGGCYDNLFFHAGQRARQGYVSYTPAANIRWSDDEIGINGLAGTGFAMASGRCWNAFGIISSSDGCVGHLCT